VLVAIFAGVVLTPVGLYLYLAHPAWTWMYLVNPDDVPALAVVPLVVMHAALLFAGWYLAARLLRAGKVRALGITAGVVTVAALVLAIVLRDRLLAYGDFIDWERTLREACGAGRPCTLNLMEVKLGYVLVALALGVGASAGYVAVELFRDSRRVRSRG